MNRIKNIRKIVLFMILAYMSAFFFEEVPRIVFIEILNHPSMKHVIESTDDFILFSVWYGVIFLVSYMIFIGKPIKYAVIFGIVFGMLVETFLFKKMNIISFFIFPLLYGGMFYVPFKTINVAETNSSNKSLNQTGAKNAPPD